MIVYLALCSKPLSSLLLHPEECFLRQTPPLIISSKFSSRPVESSVGDVVQVPFADEFVRLLSLFLSSSFPYQSFSELGPPVAQFNLRYHTPACWLLGSLRNPSFFLRACMSSPPRPHGRVLPHEFRLDQIDVSRNPSSSPAFSCAPVPLAVLLPSLMLTSLQRPSHPFDPNELGR